MKVTVAIEAIQTLQVYRPAITHDDGDYNTFVDIGENSGAGKDGGTSNGAAKT